MERLIKGDNNTDHVVVFADPSSPFARQGEVAFVVGAVLDR